MFSLIIRRVGVDGIDRILGFFFGMLRGCLLVLLVLWIAKLLGFSKMAWWQESQLIPIFSWMQAVLVKQFTHLRWSVPSVR